MRNERKPSKKRGSGGGDVIVPFFSHAVVACMDLVCKVVAKHGLPGVVEKSNSLAVQLCFDLACSIQDRISENHLEVGGAMAVDVRRFWDGRVPAVRDAYQKVDAAKSAMQELEEKVQQCSALVRETIPDSEIQNIPQFRSLSELVQLKEESLPGVDLASRLEERMMARRSEADIAYLKAKEALREAKRVADSRDTTEYVKYKDVLVGKWYDAVFDLKKSRMMELSDVSRRLALQDDCDWIAQFWTEADALAKNPREFPAETFALRDSKNAQYVLDRELDEAVEENRKANRDFALQRWVEEYGHSYGVRVYGFVRNAAYKSCQRQDQRVDTWLRGMGHNGLVQYLAADKTSQYVALEAHVRSDLLKEENEFSVMASRLTSPGRRIIYLGEDHLALPKGPDGDRIRNRIVMLGDTVGSVFESKAHLIDRLRRFLPIRMGSPTDPEPWPEDVLRYGEPRK
jgi:hypothetical protein